MVASAGHDAGGYDAAAVHESIVGVTAGDGRKAGVRKDVGGVQECAAQAVADEMLRVQWVLARRRALFLLTGDRKFRLNAIEGPVKAHWGLQSRGYPGSGQGKLDNPIRFVASVGECYRLRWAICDTWFTLVERDP